MQFAISHPATLGIDSRDFEYLFKEGTPPPLLGIFLLLNVFRSKKLIVIKINGHLGGQKMAYYVLSVLPSINFAQPLHCVVDESQVYTIT